MIVLPEINWKLPEFAAIWSTVSWSATKSPVTLTFPVTVVLPLTNKLLAWTKIPVTVSA